MPQGDAVARSGVLGSGGLSRVEAGLRGITPANAERLMDCYGVTDDDVRTEILELIRLDQRLRRSPAWFKRHLDVLSPTDFDKYLALEAAASELRNYEPLVVPGILQTVDYANAVVSLRPDLTPAQVRRVVEVRAARQRRLLTVTGEGDGPRLSFIVDERALDSLTRPEIMVGQMRRLLEASEHSKITMRLSPRSIGLHPGLTGGFVIMKFPSPAVRDVACVELMSRSVYPQDEDEIARYHTTFDWLWERSLTTDETRERLKITMEELQQ